VVAGAAASLEGVRDPASGIRGVYHSVSKKWLQGYFNEYAWRYNRRDSDRSMFKELLAEAVERAV
jgi:hypothetical protein